VITVTFMDAGPGLVSLTVGLMSAGVAVGRRSFAPPRLRGPGQGSANHDGRQAVA
jgi:hypothetical protein